jgi:N-acetyl sugar amidotransferase
MSYQICTKTIMDTSDPEITFDKNGICNHYHDFFKVSKQELNKSKKDLDLLIEEIKASKKSGYNCIVGLSGGVDSSYVALKAFEFGLNPLIVHLDNGWNSELAVQNITDIIQTLNFDLHTHVINWEEFKSLQRAYLEASVIDVEVLTDHAITALLYQLAEKHGIKYILSGTNVNTEAIMPKSWVYQKNDLVNIKAIYKAHGGKKLKTYPHMGLEKQLYKKHIKKIQYVPLLDYLDFHKDKAKQSIIEKLHWKDYGGKHHESIFTRFYQSYYLPKKFGVDKRRAHLSTLICSGQTTREQALIEIKAPCYASEKLMHEDFEYVAGKLGYSIEEFEAIMQMKPVSHYAYATDKKRRDLVFKDLYKTYSKLKASKA